MAAIEGADADREGKVERFLAGQQYQLFGADLTEAHPAGRIGSAFTISARRGERGLMQAGAARTAPTVVAACRHGSAGIDPSAWASCHT